MIEYDVIIIGSGPAGVSAAFPLLHAGLRVLMLDAGKQASGAMIQTSFTEFRKNSCNQFEVMVGKDFHSLKMQDAISPKLRVPALSYVFNGFEQHSGVRPSNFIGIGSLAAGGLSNAWGAGVARYNGVELAHFPFSADELHPYYQEVSTRIGLSGANTDELVDYFGVDQEAATALPMDNLQEYLFSRVRKIANQSEKPRVRFGRSRVAVLSSEKGNRKGCDLQGNCLWGCSRGAIYSAVFDLEQLKKMPGFSYRSDCLVNSFQKLQTDDAWEVIYEEMSSGSFLSVCSNRIFLAAGTLSTTRLALQLLNFTGSRTLLSSPTAAFLACVPRFVGQARKSGFGLGQISYVVDCGSEIKAFGSTFATTGIPMSEFIGKVPLVRPASIKLLSVLLSSCFVGNLFLPGNLTKVSARLNSTGELLVAGGYTDEVNLLMKSAKSSLAHSFRKLGAFMMPGSFTLGKPGSDIHYAGTLPMRNNPEIGETSKYGELFGASGIYVVDGASLSYLSEKSHTLTIMANAARIASYVASLKSS